MPSTQRMALGFAAGLLSLAAFAAAPPDLAVDGVLPQAQALPTWIKPVVCDWSEGDGTPTASTAPGSVRWGWVDLSAGYWQFVLDGAFPVGTRFRIDGQYPAARNFSFQVYNGQSQGLFYLPDYRIQPDAGSSSPFVSVNDVNTAIPPYGKYSVQIVFDAIPANPAPNTIYVDGSSVSIASYPIFVYRVYNAFTPFAVADHGGVPLPSVVEETAAGDVPIASLQTPLPCNIEFGLRDGERRTVANLSDDFFAQPLHPKPIPPTPVPAAPAFALYPSSSSTDYFVNDETQYLYVQFSQTAADLFLVRARAPSFPTQAGASSDPQLRHWSLCQNSYSTYASYDCLEDQSAVLDGDGYFNLVVSVPTKLPAGANPQHGFNWLSYGTTDQGLLIYRQMLASPDFTQSAFNVPSGGSAQAVMGPYFPLTTYCAGSVFDAHTQAGQTPAQVFAACAAGH